MVSREDWFYKDRIELWSESLVISDFIFAKVCSRKSTLDYNEYLLSLAYSITTQNIGKYDNFQAGACQLWKSTFQTKGFNQGLNTKQWKMHDFVCHEANPIKHLQRFKFFTGSNGRNRI